MKPILTGVADFLLKQGLAAEQRRAGLAVASVKLSFGRLEYLERAGAAPLGTGGVIALARLPACAYRF